MVGQTERRLTSRREHKLAGRVADFETRSPFKPARRAVPIYAAGRKYRRLLDGVYVDRSVLVTPAVKARAAWVWSDGNCILSGISAAAIWRVKWLPEANAVILMDALYQATGLSPDSLREWADMRPGYKGIRKLRRVMELSDAGAESPRETLLRLLVLDAGLPRPVTQYVVRDRGGRFIGRADLASPEWKVALEYEGAHHFNDPVQARRDALRASAYMQADWRTIRVLSELSREPEALLNQIISTLRAAGAPI
ncbi:hypothetical protein [Hoyosella subflava]|uniref:DUF559 domain-containing protein n=1 Tax=Hoyosella subflava (strain DSM 45089 / JCM 17490 / NBRC 109087 / DQS3-9A1) TaxID=443218 RepID=F6EJY9_HOYSD|nr:hypothetical protein [Hoyosella subflava]AEF41347.1 hypothetical protein AS9A_2900 [Hoyosella subflava DQS3-9A1]